MQWICGLNSFSISVENADDSHEGKPFPKKVKLDQDHFHSNLRQVPHLSNI